MSQTRTHFRTCNLCEAMCGLEITVDGERITRIRGDAHDEFSRGHICPKAPALEALHEDPDRLRHPVRRTPDGWERVGWDEALTEIVDRIHEIQQSHGRDAVGIYVGNPTVHDHGSLIFGPMLLRALRTKNRYSATSVDQLPHMFASYLMFGHQLLLPIPDIDRAHTFLMLGANPLASNGSLMTAPDVRNRLADVKKRGKLIVVDPRRTETARLADEHLFIRPGTDALFLAALLRELFVEHGASPPDLGVPIEGVDRLRAAVEPFTVERAAAHTGIEATAIRRIANRLATKRPSVVYGRMGCSTQRFGAICQWLINAINLVTGNLDRPGGAMFTEPAFDIVNPPAGMGTGKGSIGRWRSTVRGLPEVGGELPVAVLAEEILDAGDDRIRAVITSAGNPVLSTPDGRRLDEAFGSLDFMVSVDPYVNETTRHADFILPPPSQLQKSHYDAAFHLLAVRNTAKWSPPLFDHRDDTRHEWWVFNQMVLGLLRRRGASRTARARQRALGALGPDRLLDIALRLGPSKLSLRKLKAAPHGLDLGPLRRCLARRMPAGRAVEAAPEELVGDLDRLAERYPARVGSAAPNGRFALIGRRHLRSNNSWMHNVEKLVAGKPRCTLLMHPDDAARLDLHDGIDVEIESRVGAVVAPLEVSDQVMPGVVSLPHGFGHHRPGTRLSVAERHAGVSANDLTDPEALDELSGNAALNGVEVTVSAARG